MYMCMYVCIYIYIYVRATRTRAAPLPAIRAA